jgi:hypothetical protein
LIIYLLFYLKWSFLSFENLIFGVDFLGESLEGLSSQGIARERKRDVID